MARSLKKKMAILTHCLTSRDAWSDKQINYGWGSMNMPVGRWGGLAIMASAISDHPLAREWLRPTGRYFKMLLETEYSPDGVHISCPHYISASSTSFYAWIALANNGLAEDVSTSARLRNFARYSMQLMTPVDPRWGIRTLLTEGDTRPGGSALPGVLATLFRKTDEWYEKGVPLTLYTGDMYQPGAVSALSHNTLAWDVRPEGDPTPGKDRPGDWYHDHQIPWVEHTRRPRLHIQAGWDPNRQKITETRGRITWATDQPAAALLEGRVQVSAFTEVPTRANYSVAMQQQATPPLVRLPDPFSWTRRVPYVKAPTSNGMNDLAVRDDLGGFARHAPSFSFWSLSESVETLDHRAHFKGQLGVDTGLFMAAPESGRWFTDFFTHTECEGIVRARGFSGEKQVLARFDGVKGQGLLAVLFPRLAGEPRPEFQTRAGGFQIRWKDETHYVLLETAERSVEDAGLEATASCLVAKMRDKKHFTLCLPAGGKARYVGKKLASDGPAEIAVVDGKKQRAEGRDLRRRQQSRNFNRELTMAGLGAPRYFAAPISRSHSIAAGSHFMTGANVVEETPRRPLPVAAPAAILAAAKRFRSPARHIRWLFES